MLQAFSVEHRVLGGYKLLFAPAGKRLPKLSLSDKTLLMLDKIFYPPSHSSILFWPSSCSLLPRFPGKMCVQYMCIIIYMYI